ncbi:MAG: acylphosphatase [Phycisphaerales bacterium]
MRVRVRYSGRVQGVGFRATARSLSRGFAVSGWVQNELVGTVLLEVQGEPAAVQGYLDALREELGSNIKGEDRSTLADDPAQPPHPASGSPNIASGIVIRH